MSSETISILKVVGEIAGVGGLSLGFLLLVFRQIIARNWFPRLSREHAYKIILTIVLCAWSVAVLGLAGYFFARPPSQHPPKPDKSGRLYIFTVTDSAGHAVTAHIVYSKAVGGIPTGREVVAGDFTDDFPVTVGPLPAGSYAFWAEASHDKRSKSFVDTVSDGMDDRMEKQLTIE